MAASSPRATGNRTASAAVLPSDPPFSFPILQSIDPGQQFTWEHSNLEVNKPKNRYANVIAYDHSRVILLPIEGRSSPTASRAAMDCAGSTPHTPLSSRFISFSNSPWGLASRRHLCKPGICYVLVTDTFPWRCNPSFQGLLYQETAFPLLGEACLVHL